MRVGGSPWNSFPSEQAAAATVQLEVSRAGSVETDLIRKKVGEVSRSGSKLNFKIQPWKIRTFEIL